MGLQFTLTISTNRPWFQVYARWVLQLAKPVKNSSKLGCRWGYSNTAIWKLICYLWLLISTPCYVLLDRARKAALSSTNLQKAVGSVPHQHLIVNLYNLCQLWWMGSHCSIHPSYLKYPRDSVLRPLLFLHLWIAQSSLHFLIEPELSFTQSTCTHCFEWSTGQRISSCSIMIYYWLTGYNIIILLWILLHVNIWLYQERGTHSCPSLLLTLPILFTCIEGQEGHALPYPRFYNNTDNIKFNITVGIIPWPDPI